jgi:hypothetical protein
MRWIIVLAASANVLLLALILLYALIPPGSFLGRLDFQCRLPPQTVLRAVADSEVVFPCRWASGPPSRTSGKWLLRQDR